MDIQFSVVIPLYNKEKYVAQTLKSVVGQTYQNFEIIVVNDCSTDNSLGVVKAIDDSRIKTIEHSKNKGLSASRNTGIKAAAHSFIAFLDADDHWDSSFLETISKLIKKYPKESVFATHYRENYRGKIILPKSKLPTRTKGKSLVINDFFKVNLGRLILTQSCIVVHKTVFEQIGYYDENVTFAEDIDFFVRCFHTYDLAYFNNVCHTQNVALIGSLSETSTKNKTYPALEKYQIEDDSQLKFVHFYLYCFCQKIKSEKRFEDMKTVRKEINPRFLNFTQRLLLLSPLFIYRPILIFKRFAKSLGFELSTY